VEGTASFDLLFLEVGRPTGPLLLFDNGLDRASGRFPRALEVRLDRAGETAEVVWEFRPTPDIHAPIGSSLPAKLRQLLSSPRKWSSPSVSRRLGTMARS
jgi:hypothetical protein